MQHLHFIDLLRCMLAACFRVDAALLIEAAAKQDSIEAIREIVIHCGLPISRSETRDEKRDEKRDEDGNKTDDLIQCLIR